MKFNIAAKCKSFVDTNLIATMQSEIHTGNHQLDQNANHLLAQQIRLVFNKVVFHFMLLLLLFTH